MGVEVTANKKSSRRVNLTEAAVQRYKAPTDRQFDNYYDAIQPGLVLRVNSGGRKSWVALWYKKTTTGGRKLSIPTTTQLNVYPTLKLKEARAAARKFLADPQKGLSERQGGEGGETFEKVAETFFRHHVLHHGFRTSHEIKRILTKYIYSEWKNKEFRQIKRKDITALLDKIVEANGAPTADVVLAVISSLTRWQVTRDDDYNSPVVKGMKRATKTPRERVLNDEELRAVMKAAKESGGAFGAFVQVSLLTAQRREKIRTLKWSDLNDEGVWTIQTEKREKSNAKALRLPPAVLDIIEARPKFVGNPYVFATSGKGPIASLSKDKAKFDKQLPPMPNWTFHDLRRTARSLMSKAGVSRDHAERVLGHAIRGVEGVYDRHGYAEEKAEALMKLSVLVDQIVTPPAGNVVGMERVQRKRRLKGRTA
jgi:integrase